MKKMAFTLIEVMLVIIIAGILFSVGVPSYQNFVESQKAKVCQTNLRTLEQALDIYAIDHDTMPASLSEIPNETIDKAFAGILQEKGAWRIRLAYFVTDLMNHDNLLYAAPVTPFVKQLARGNHRVLVCPKDYAVLEHGGVSYGINSALAKMKKKNYKQLAATTIMLGDCDMPEFSDASQLSSRHVYHKNITQKQNYAIAISKASQLYLASGSLLSASQGASFSSSSIGKAMSSFKTNKDINALIDVEGEDGNAASAGSSTSSSAESPAGSSDATGSATSSAGAANITSGAEVEEDSAASSGSGAILPGATSEGEGTCWCKDDKTGKFYQASCPCPGTTMGGNEPQD
ncbi:MAG: prepilin-type N-terminal cleavage/methylation domain-containing protein [Candidatus Omnitrophota bacterium]